MALLIDQVRTAMLGYRSRVLVVVVACALACMAPPQPSDHERRFDAFSRLHHAAASWPERERAVMFGVIYDLVWSPVHQRSEVTMRDRDLDLLFRAAHLAASYTLDERHVHDMRSALDALERRGRARARHYTNMHGALVHARMMGAARELARQHPLAGLEVVPEVREAGELAPGQPTAWIVAPDKRELLRRSVDLSKAAQVVVISHPRCHFSRAAMLEIHADPVLASAFAEHATWLAPQGSALQFEILQRWNRDHPEQAIALTVDRSEWPMIDRWNTPTFYFLRNGVVTATVEGWPRGGRRAEIVRALRSIGLSR